MGVFKIHRTIFSAFYFFNLMGGNIFFFCINISSTFHNLNRRQPRDPLYPVSLKMGPWRMAKIYSGGGHGPKMDIQDVEQDERGLGKWEKIVKGTFFFSFHLWFLLVKHQRCLTWKQLRIVNVASGLGLADGGNSRLFGWIFLTSLAVIAQGGQLSVRKKVEQKHVWNLRHLEEWLKSSRKCLEETQRNDYTAWLSKTP